MSIYRCNICNIEEAESRKVPELCSTCGSSFGPWTNLKTGKIETAKRSTRTIEHNKDEFKKKGFDYSIPAFDISKTKLNYTFNEGKKKTEKILINNNYDIIIKTEISTTEPWLIIPEKIIEIKPFSKVNLVFEVNTSFASHIFEKGYINISAEKTKKSIEIELKIIKKVTSDSKTKKIKSLSGLLNSIKSSIPYLFKNYI